MYGNKGGFIEINLQTGSIGKVVQNFSKVDRRIVSSSKDNKSIIGVLKNRTGNRITERMGKKLEGARMGDLLLKHVSKDDEQIR